MEDVSLIQDDVKVVSQSLDVYSSVLLFAFLLAFVRRRRRWGEGGGGGGSVPVSIQDGITRVCKTHARPTPPLRSLPVSFW